MNNKGPLSSETHPDLRAELNDGEGKVLDTQLFRFFKSDLPLLAAFLRTRPTTPLASAVFIAATHQAHESPILIGCTWFSNCEGIYTELGRINAAFAATTETTIFMMHEDCTVFAANSDGTTYAEEHIPLKSLLAEDNIYLYYYDPLEHRIKIGGNNPIANEVKEITEASNLLSESSIETYSDKIIALVNISIESNISQILNVMCFQKSINLWNNLLLRLVKNNIFFAFVDKVSENVSGRLHIESNSNFQEMIINFIYELAKLNMNNVSSQDFFMNEFIIRYFRLIYPTDNSSVAIKRYSNEYKTLKQLLPGFRFSLIQAPLSPEKNIESERRIFNVYLGEELLELDETELLTKISEVYPGNYKTINKGGIQGELKFIVSALLNDTGNFQEVRKAANQSKRIIFNEKESKGNSIILCTYMVKIGNTPNPAIVFYRDLVTDEVYISFVDPSSVTIEVENKRANIQKTQQLLLGSQITDSSEKIETIDERIDECIMVITLILTHDFNDTDTYLTLRKYLREVVNPILTYSEAMRRLSNRFTDSLRNLLDRNKSIILLPHINGKPAMQYIENIHIVASRILDYLLYVDNASTNSYDAFTQEAKNMIDNEIKRINAEEGSDYILDDSTGNKRWNGRWFARIQIVAIKSVSNKKDKRLIIVATDNDH